jgi:DNA-binding transcriptional ArsR family regulator
MDTSEILGRLKALADENRLKLVNLLLTQDLCVGALAHRLGVSDAAVSQHLQVLRKAGLIRGEKRGYWTHYTVERSVLKDLAERLKAIADQPSCTEACCRRKAMGEVICCRREEKRDE